VKATEKEYPLPSEGAKIVGKQEVKTDTILLTLAAQGSAKIAEETDLIKSRKTASVKSVENKIENGRYSRLFSLCRVQKPTRKTALCF
jgi:hypothetical protein